MERVKALRNDLPQLALVIIALVGCINLLLGCLSMARWARHLDWLGDYLIVFSLPYAALGLLFAGATALGLLRRLRACLVVVAIALAASTALFAYDVSGRRDCCEIVLPGLGPPYRVFWWWYDPSPAPPMQPPVIHRLQDQSGGSRPGHVAVPPATSVPS